MNLPHHCRRPRSFVEYGREPMWLALLAVGSLLLSFAWPR